MKMDQEATYLVVGGGIAGVTCVEQLSQLSSEEQTIILLTSSPFVKSVSNVQQLTRVLEEFDVHEQTLSQFSKDHPNVKIVHETAAKLDIEEHKIHTSDEKVYRYRKLCLCTGARPKVIQGSTKYVLGIRDTETVKEFKSRMSDARRILIVGNGGIATEIAYEVEGCQVIWAIKDRSIGATFFDAGAAEFFLPQLSANKTKSLDDDDDDKVKQLEFTHLKRHAYGTTIMAERRPDDDRLKKLPGVSLGPDWSSGLNLKDRNKAAFHDVIVEYDTEVETIFTAEEFKCAPDVASQSFDDWNVYVRLTNGKIYGCDFVISATGVIPNSDVFCETSLLKIETAEDGGLLVNTFMQTSAKDVYAAGDVCTANWSFAPHWFQMRLWTQAKQMGSYAAKCMAAHLTSTTVHQDFCFEIFTHVTRFFGFKVILLGLYNGQGLGTDYDILLRTTKGLEYVKVVMQNGKMKGAVLVGETDLEETFENLILNQMDLSVYGTDLLNPNIDIEDYFD